MIALALMHYEKLQKMTRGEIWMADFGIPFGSETGFERPILIIQDDSFNKSKINTLIVIPLTKNLQHENFPGNVYLEKEITGLPKDSIALVSQINTIDKMRLIEIKGKLNIIYMNEIEEGIALAIGLKIMR